MSNDLLCLQLRVSHNVTATVKASGRQKVLVGKELLGCNITGGRTPLFPALIFRYKTDA